MYDRLFTEKDLLFYADFDNQTGDFDRRLCIPKNCQKFIITKAHSSHKGITKTLEDLRQVAFFHDMQQKVEFVVSNCVTCLQKLKSPLKTNIKRHRELLGYPNQRVYLDLVGPLSGNKVNGVTYKHILTILDGFTRFLTAIPLESIETEKVLDGLMNGYVFKYGLPEAIHTDNGSNLTSKLFEDSMIKLGIMHSTTPVYSPEGNRVERQHRTLNAFLRILGENPSNWVSKLN